MASKMTLLLALVALSCAPLTSSTHLQTIADSYRRGDVEKARRSLQKYLEAHPSDPQALYWASLFEPQAETSAHHLRKLLSLQPQGELADRAAISLGENLYSQGLYLSCQKALRHNFGALTQKAEAEYWLGRNFLALNQPDSAQSCFQAAISQGVEPLPKGLAQIGIGDCFFVKGEYASALREYRATEDSLPLSQLLPQILWKEALSLEGLGRNKEANKYYGYILDRFPGSYPARVAGEKLGRKPNRERFSLQLGAFKREANARNLKGLIEGDGYQAWIEVKGDLFIVLVGSLKGREEAKAFGEELKGRYKLDYRIVPLY